MSGDGNVCAICGELLSPWEGTSCRCTGPRSKTLNEVLYAIACVSGHPLHARDFVRNAERDHKLFMNEATAVTVLANDHRFCWAGRGLYGLYRHGPLPGPRNLEQAARVTLAAGGPLTPEEVDFCLKQFGYRYNVASLRNAAARSEDIFGSYGLWDHNKGEAAQRSLRYEIPVVPLAQRAAWEALRGAIEHRIQTAISDRDARLKAVADGLIVDIDWTE